MKIPTSTLSTLLPLLIASGILPLAEAQFTQVGSKLTGSGAIGSALQGNAVAVSTDGSTIIVGGFFDNTLMGAAWVYTRVNGAWTQQGSKLVGAGATGTALQGCAVAISGDGNTAVIGGYTDNSGAGAAWIFTRTSGIWSQQGNKLVGTGAVGSAGQGVAVAISNDGNTVVIGGNSDSQGAGAVWVFTRTGTAWSQQGLKLVGSGAVGQLVEQGDAVAISGDGNTLIEGGPGDSDTGAAWVFTRTAGVWTQQSKLTASGSTGLAGVGDAVAISGDGNTAAMGGAFDSNGVGGVWIFTRTSGAWTQQGNKLVGVNAVDPANQGNAVAMSADGNTVVVGGLNDNGEAGAAWAFVRASGMWLQEGAKLIGTGAVGAAGQGRAVALSADGTTAVVGGNLDNAGAGAIWTFTAPPLVTTIPSPVGVSPNFGSGTTQSFAFTFSDTGGWQSLSVVDVLIRSVLDAKQACYVAFVPSGASSGSVYLVDDKGDAGGPYSGMLLPGTGMVSNSQCSMTGAGSSVVTSGNTLTLTLAITFTPGFTGNQVLYMSARDASVTSNWQALGTWNVPGPPAIGPAVTGMTPGYSTSATQTYTFTFSDSVGWQDIVVTDILVNGAINGVNACYLAYVPAGAATGSVFLVDNAGDAGGPYSGMVLPGTGTVSNSQCSIAGTGSSVTASGNTLTLTLVMTFNHTFTGNQLFFLAARNNTLNSGWQAVGAIAVP